VLVLVLVLALVLSLSLLPVDMRYLPRLYSPIDVVMIWWSLYLEFRDLPCGKIQCGRRCGAAGPDVTEASKGSFGQGSGHGC
jgi:hypothetical protein